MLEDITWEVTMRTINGFDHIVFPTATQQELFEQEGLRAPSSVISNGVDTERYHPGEADPELVRRYALPPGPRLLMVGRLARDKKLGVAIRALAMLEHGRLLLAGRGDDRERLEELAIKQGVDDRVHFLGFVPEQDLPDLYRACDLFLIASEVEVQSIPTIQAAATGLPIVAANAAALPELVKDGQNGYLVPPDDDRALAHGLTRILSSPTRRAAFGRASLAIGQPHADHLTLGAYEQLFHSVANHRTTLQ
jgi:glycosyltransferase involved in cell wall biosynthesis